MDNLIGKRLDGLYEVQELIGSGGMANVYKAVMRGHNGPVPAGTVVAVKVLRQEYMHDPDLVRRFKNESKAISLLNHPNIVTIYEFGEDQGVLFIAMERVRGQDLEEMLQQRSITPGEALEVLAPVCDGLQFAHRHHIIHRYIKPQNIWVLRDVSVKVADFVIACLANASQALTQEALGSVHYISPEQARVDRIDARSDIYSAGVVLYEMLTGRLPFEGDSAVSVAIQHLSSVPLAPRDIDPSIPEPLELICMKAMNSDPDKRYPTADAMLAGDEAVRMQRLIDVLESLDDVQEVYTSVVIDE